MKKYSQINNKLKLMYLSARGLASEIAVEY